MAELAEGAVAPRFDNDEDNEDDEGTQTLPDGTRVSTNRMLLLLQLLASFVNDGRRHA